MFFLLLSTWTWDTFLTLRGVLGALNYVLPPRSPKSYGVGLWGGWVAHEILVTAQRPNSSFIRIWALDWDLALALGLSISYLNHFQKLRSFFIRLDPIDILKRKFTIF